MPPKLRKPVAKPSDNEIDVTREFREEHREESASSEDTLGPVTSPASITMTATHLDQLISSLVAAMPTPTAAIAHVAVPPAPRPVPIKLTCWSDDDIPSEFFKKYEKAMGHNRHAKSEWGSLLPVYMTGRVQAAFSQVADDDLDNWELVKESLLELLGDTPSFADRRWWTLSRLPNEDIGAFYLRIRSTRLRRVDGLKTRDEVVEQTILSHFLSLLPQDCYASVADRRPKDGQSAARMAQEWEDTRAFRRRHRPWRTGQRPYNSFRGSEGEPHGGNGSASNSGSRMANVSSSSGNVNSTGNVASGGSRVPSSQENASRLGPVGLTEEVRGRERQ